MRTFKTIISILLVTVSFSGFAEKYKYESKSKRDKPPGTAANCSSATASTELDINNTRALIQTGGDMWWDFNRSRYEIPKGSEKTSLFAGSLWLAGQDISGQFKVAALRFRTGNDYWTGPLSTVDAEIDAATCKLYDKHFETSRSMVSAFAAWFQAGVDDALNGTTTQADLYPGYTIPTVITEWPAHGRDFEPYNEDYYLAPFFDRNGDGEYNPNDGDYPGYVLTGKADCSRRVKDIYGDQNLWWVFNDKGNIHTESSGQSIGMEIRAQAFAFATTDEVNNMTFYNYELINRSTFFLKDTYFGQWADGDLGNAQDDFVGCDVRRGLGYFYNGDDDDQDAGGNIGYGTNPPAIGIDFFQGPFQANDNRDNCLCTNDYAAAIEQDGIVYSGQGAGYGDGIVDNERYGMRKFLYHNNSSGPAATQDPRIATDYYNMLRGIWKDGTPMTFGGNGYNPSDPNAIPAHYMFPGKTDPQNWGTDGVDPGQSDWSEVTAGNPPGDRRFVQSSGPFQLAPGQVNNITVGIVWMQAQSGGRLQSVEEMRNADDKTQALFDSCFEILDGPHAPDVTIQELDGEVILMLSNPINSNNYQEGYATVDPFQAAPDSVDSNEDGDLDLALTLKEKEVYATYKFEGYQVFQLYDESVGTNDLDDPDKARLVAQVDIRNDVDRLINYVFNSELKVDEPQLMVDGTNEGIRHSFQIKEDAFATGNSRLINNKTYYYMVVAYAYNRYGDGYENLQYIDGIYDPATRRLDGQKIPYLASRTSPSGPVRVYEAIPHKTEFEQNGIELNSKYGDGVELTKIEGRGNGGNYAIIKEDYLDSIATSVELPRVKYKAGNGPVGIQVVDPLMVQPGNYTLAMKDTSATGDLANMYWEITGDSLETTITSDQTIRYGNEQVVFELGLSVFVQYGYPATIQLPSGNGGVIFSSTNGYIGFDVIYEDETDQWLTGLVDADANSAFNWIKSGNVLTPFVGDQGDVKPFDHDDHTDDYRKYGRTDDPGAFLDEEQNWENIAGRTWAPFALCSYDTAHPIPFFDGDVSFAESIIQLAGLHNTPSVDVVITGDRDKWTRCAVLEAGENATLTQGGVLRGEIRRGLSVDKDGRNQLDPNFNASEGTMGGTQVLGDKVSLLTVEEKEYFKGIGFDAAALRGVSFGMGWFPGYAIDVETGERLNMAFSEDSWLANENGADMMWNPTSSIAEVLFGELRLGGKHMIYVFRHNVEDADIVDAGRLMPAYDEGDFLFDKLIGFNGRDFAMRTDRSNALNKDYFAVMRAGAWVGYPLVAEDFKLFGKNAGSQESTDFNEITIQLRSEQSYGRYASGDIIEVSGSSTVAPGSSYYVRSGSVSVPQTVGGTSTPVTFNSGSVFTAETSSITTVSTEATLVKTINEGLPLFNFNLDDLAPTINTDIGVSQLDNISIVPNPYYAYSEYETGRLDNRVKIINLPEQCTINIFTVNGVLVRTYRKDDPTVSSVDWDLKNQDNITIASGLYVVHINVPGIGEKVLKWFGVLRPIDLNSF